MESYSYKDFKFHYYLIPIYIIPIVYIKSKKVLPLILLFISLFLFLLTYWSTKFLVLFCFNKSKEGSYIIYNNKICKKFKENNKFFIIFNNLKYQIINNEFKLIEPKFYTFKEYKKLIKQPDFDILMNNKFIVPKPSYLKMLKIAFLSPLFVFQIFSSSLMLFDEYVYRSMLSIASVIATEACLVFSRFLTMRIFRSMERPIIKIKLEDGKEVDADTLKPGNIIEITDTIQMPCDALILEGDCACNEAMLSGESVPLTKTEINSSDDILNFDHHKKHILFSGTKIEKIDKVKCYVLRTGFYTEQGKLLNKMLHSEDISYDPEALKFIVGLVGISLIFSIYTFLYSKKVGYDLFIDILVLFTNSIPFELPMEMSLAMTNAVKELMKLKIFCLEPFRIGLAGKTTVCCFDKTGTLTDTKLNLLEIKYGNSESETLLRSCTELFLIDNIYKGDPLDMAICEKLGIPLPKIKNYSFSSENMRQTVITDDFVIMKGAPEQVKKFLHNVPTFYEEYKEYAKEGIRVLALAYKRNKNVNDRATAEQKLIFNGFCLFGASLKDGAEEMISALQRSNHRVIMITGDNLLTAESVARKLHFRKVRCMAGKDIYNNDINEINVFGRADPKDKEVIIKRLQENNTVMMVGDGTNDVGALKAADVGVAMLEGPCTATISITQEQVIAPGDASVAAPFSVRSNSLRSIIEIIQQGRSSLVTTVQMYKILALSSIVNGFSMALLDIVGLKFSESQMLSLGIVSALAFNAISNPKKLPFISKKKPISTIFHRYIISSLIIQAIIHSICFIMVFNHVEHPKLADKFEMSVFNTVIYIVCCVQTFSMFICNYIGRPFRENLRENKVLFWSLLTICLFIANVMLDFMPNINEMLNISDITKYNLFTIKICCFCFFGSYFAENICFKLLI